MGLAISVILKLLGFFLDWNKEDKKDKENFVKFISEREKRKESISVHDAESEIFESIKEIKERMKNEKI